MGKVYDDINEKIQQWIDRQNVFFVATAPLSGDGLVNLSPKGHDTLRVIDSHTLAYMDYGGSGIETLSHVRENGRIVIMFCAFEGPPLIFRFHGECEAITPADAGFDELASHFDDTELGIRCIIRIKVDRVSDSCGYGVPFFDYRGERPSSKNYIESKSVAAMREYFATRNATSLDGLPGLSEAEAEAYRGPGEV